MILIKNFRVNDDKEATILLIHIEPTMESVDSSFYLHNTRHFMRFIPSEIEIRYYQNEIDSDSDKYFYQFNTAIVLSVLFLNGFGGYYITQKYYLIHTIDLFFNFDKYHHCNNKWKIIYISKHPHD